MFDYGYPDDAETESFDLDEIDLGEDLPCWAEDIRNQIGNKPANVVAVRTRHGDDHMSIVYYYGWEPA